MSAPSFRHLDLESGPSGGSLASPMWGRLTSPMGMMSYNAATYADIPKASNSLCSARILGLWALFVLNRAMHPIVIDLSKEPSGKLPYDKLSPVIAKCFLSVLVCNACALLSRDGWRAGLQKCYGLHSLRVFGTIGAFYALGDYLEMSSMASMSGAAYQVLLQSKLMITALMMWAIKGSAARQSPAQWSVLVTVTLAMCLFMLVQSSSSTTGSAAPAGLSGVGFALTKVCVSCYSAVKADQSLKRFKTLPLYAQLSQLMMSWGLISLAMCAVLNPATAASPAAFFRGWNTATCLVVASFAAKTVLTMTLLKVLDSVQKNIGEAVAVMVIYFAQVVLPIFPTHFEASTFMAMLLVVMAVTTYLLLKQDGGSKSKAALEMIPELEKSTSGEAAEESWAGMPVGSPGAACNPRQVWARIGA